MQCMIEKGLELSRERSSDGLGTSPRHLVPAEFSVMREVLTCLDKGMSVAFCKRESGI